MRLVYDSEGDVLNVIFDERLQDTDQIAYRLRDGLMLYVTVDSTKPVQLTVVNYRRLARQPQFHFNGWEKLKATDRKKLLPVLASSALSTFLKIDPQTGFGHLISPPVLDVFSLAA